MPELPEVETVARGLQAVLPGKRILEVRLGKTDFIDDPPALEEKLPGSRISAVRRHGKFLLVDLERERSNSSSTSLMIHLGMTGRIVTCPPETMIAPHTHVFFSLDDGCELRYTDARRFGRMSLIEDGNREKILGPLGLDPLEASAAQFSAQIGGRSARIKALLLDQRVFRGIGNIYADESLWRARIHPMRTGASLKREELNRLRKAAQKVLTEAIRLRGSSISDFVDSDGLPGEFQLWHRVYQRHGEKCVRCRAVIRREIVAGRSTHFCPRCQPAPRKSNRAHRQR
jgi:formamidopyrimidine-DNA glycosylase